jgi:hypothetical protein
MALKLRPISKESFAMWNGAPVFPPRPPRIHITGDSIALLQNDDHVCEPKLNDSHLLLAKQRDVWEFWSRHGTLLAYQPSTKLYEYLESLDIPNGTVFDGGLLHMKHSAIKHKLVLWDILVSDGKWREKKTYQENREVLEKLTRLKTIKGGMKTVWLQLLNFLRDDSCVFLAPWVSGKQIKPYFEWVIKKDPFATYREDGVTASACMLEGLVVKYLKSPLLVRGNTIEYGGQVKLRRATGRHQF